MADKLKRIMIEVEDPATGKTFTQSVGVPDSEAIFVNWSFHADLGLNLSYDRESHSAHLDASEKTVGLIYLKGSRSEVDTFIEDFSGSIEEQLEIDRKPGD